MSADAKEADIQRNFRLAELAEAERRSRALWARIRAAEHNAMIRAHRNGLERLVTTSTYDRSALLDSYRRLARVAGLGTAQGPARERQRPRSLSPG
ncbi:MULTISPECIES: hypothetical protein [unclassified Streptomyces]|uniref:hypothetical protein n=1 Tax=unclassified Streptomyces TaxID=2593676 RepID=UPI003D8C37A6